MPPLANYFEVGVDKVGGVLSTHAAAGDAVIHSDLKNIMIQGKSGTSAIYIKNADNKVGISNATPAEALDVIGTVQASTGYKTGTYGPVIDALGNFTGVNGTLSGNLIVDTDTFYVDSSNNNVGICTSTPDAAYKLHIKGDARIEGNITVNGTTTIVNTETTATEQLLITNDGTGPAVRITQTGANKILEVLDDENICFSIEDNGHVLIGCIDDSTYQLDVSGNTRFKNHVDISENLNVSGDAVIVGGLTCATMTINGDFDVSGNIDISENFRILTDKVVFTPTGNGTLAGTLDAAGDFRVNTNKFVVLAETGNTTVAGTIDIANDLKLATNKFTVLAATGNTTVAGTIDIASDLKLATDKFIVLAASGNTTVAGTIDIANDLKLATNKFTVLAASGNTTVAGTLDAAGNFKVADTKFTVMAENGNTAVAGTLAVTNNLSVATDKFTVVAANGNTTLAGTLDISSNFKIAETKFTVDAPTGNTVSAGTLDIASNFKVATDKFTVAGDTGNTLTAGSLDVAKDLKVNTDKFTVASTTGNTVIAGTLALAGNLAIDTDVLFVDVAANKVGINSITPAHALDVSGDIATNNAIMFNSGTDGAFAHRSYNVAASCALLQDSTGKTTINCKAGSGNIIFKHGGDAAKQEFDSDGNVIIQGNLFSYSDARIKTNVETIPDALNKVLSLRGVTYNMIKDMEIDPETAPKHLGVIAQEIEAVIPEAVKEENGIKTVAYGNIVGLLIEAIKDLNDQMNSVNK